MEQDPGIWEQLKKMSRDDESDYEEEESIVEVSAAPDTSKTGAFVRKIRSMMR